MKRESNHKIKYVFQIYLIKEFLVEYCNYLDDLYQIITQFQNNRFGNKEKHPLITSVYFSKKIANEYLERIDNAILSVDDPDKRMSLINTYQKVIDDEYKKVDYYRYIADTKKISGIDFNQTRNIIESLKKFTQFGEETPVSKRGK